MLDIIFGTDRYRHIDFNVLFFSHPPFRIFLACAAGAWKLWAQGRFIGVREGDTRGEKELPLPSRVSLARPCSFLRPLLLSACYAG